MTSPGGLVRTNPEGTPVVASLGTAPLTLKPVIDLTDLRAQIDGLLTFLDEAIDQDDVAQTPSVHVVPSDEQHVTDGGPCPCDPVIERIDSTTLSEAQDLTDEDFISEDADEDVLTIERGFEPGVAATISVEQGHRTNAVYVHDDDLDDLIAFLSALRTIRDHA